MIVDKLPDDVPFKNIVALSLINGLKGYSPADSVQDFKKSPNHVLKYNGTTHTVANKVTSTKLY